LLFARAAEFDFYQYKKFGDLVLILKNLMKQDQIIKQRLANNGLAKVAVQSSLDTLVVNQILALRINICGINRHLRQAANCFAQKK